MRSETSRTGPAARDISRDMALKKIVVECESDLTTQAWDYRRICQSSETFGLLNSPVGYHEAGWEAHGAPSNADAGTLFSNMSSHFSDFNLGSWPTSHVAISYDQGQNFSNANAVLNILSRVPKLTHTSENAFYLLVNISHIIWIQRPRNKICLGSIIIEALPALIGETCQWATE